MRVGLFAHRIAHADATGISRYVRELVRGLASTRRPSDELILVSTRQRERADWLPEGITVGVVAGPRRPIHLAWCLGAGPRVERSLGELDVLHLLYPFPPAATRAAQIVTIHDVMPLERPEWYPRSEVLVYRRCMNLLRRRAQKIVVPSQYVADRTVAALGLEPDRIAVVPHGVSGVFGGAGGGADVTVCGRIGVEPQRFAIAVGAVSTRKNLIPVIRAVAGLSGPALPLVIVGPDGHGAQETDAAIARLRADGRVRRTGYLPDSEVAALVRSAAVLVHPSLEEGFGFVPLEAMAAGTPVVAGRVSSIPEVVGDAALLVADPSDPGAWAAALAEVTDSGETRRRWSEAGRARARLFSWRRAAATMLDLYNHAARS